ncbi:MAG TPA: hypothetical protein VLJ58_09610, partial [Ramlibacter sp.]|nr:hypothetical protein [Ramlibacter sp.]
MASARKSLGKPTAPTAPTAPAAPRSRKPPKPAAAPPAALKARAAAKAEAAAAAEVQTHTRPPFLRVAKPDSIDFRDRPFRPNVSVTP